MGSLGSHGTLLLLAVRTIALVTTDVADVVQHRETRYLQLEFRLGSDRIIASEVRVMTQDQGVFVQNRDIEAWD